MLQHQYSYILRSSYSYGYTDQKGPRKNVLPSGVARPKLMVGPDYRGTKEVLEDLALAAPG